MDHIRINGDRLWQTLMRMAQIGSTPAGGCARLALTDLDKEGRDLFVSWCVEADCTVEIDEMGNIFATRQGESALSPVMTGSHLDTQPTGGKFDGVYGVLAGLEVIRSMNDRDLVTKRPVQVVVWTNEEGARFQPAMMGSGVLAGAFDLQEIYNNTDVAGLRLEDELERIGYKGAKPAAPPEARAYFEAHIEQGPILEAEQKTIGIVTHQQGIRWYNVCVEGQESHAGTTPMPLRKDALVTAAGLAVTVQKIAEAHAPAGCGTVGRFECFPGSPNTIPGKVTFSVDFRHPDNSVLDEMEKMFRDSVDTLNNEFDIQVDGYWRYPARAFDKGCVGYVEHAARLLGYPAMQMLTGAGHDASYMAQVIPTSMIFIPCAGGLSHNEAEDASKADCEAGANVLLQTMLAAAN